MYDPYCRGCIYRRPLRDSKCFDGLTACHYMLDTGKPRGCPAGAGCIRKTVKAPKRHKKSRAMTVIMPRPQNQNPPKV